MGVGTAAGAGVDVGESMSVGTGAGVGAGVDVGTGKAGYVRLRERSAGPPTNISVSTASTPEAGMWKVTDL